METLKRCTKCKEEKPATLEHFLAQKKLLSGLSSWCRECMRALNRSIHARRKAENPEAVREKKRASRARRIAENPEAVRAKELANTLRQKAKDPEKFRAKERERRKRDPERFRAKGRESAARRRAKDQEKVNAEMREFRDRQKLLNPEKVRQRQKANYEQQRTKDVEAFRERGRLQHAKRRARIKDLPDTFTKTEWEYAVAWWGGCAYCGVTLSTRDLTIDHIIPISSPDCPGTIAENIVPACKSCNCAKHALPIHEFLERNFGEVHAANCIALITAFINNLKAGDETV